MHQIEKTCSVCGKSRWVDDNGEPDKGEVLQKTLAEMYRFAIYAVETQEERVRLKEILLQAMTQEEYDQILYPKN